MSFFNSIKTSFPTRVLKNEKKSYGDQINNLRVITYHPKSVSKMYIGPVTRKPGVVSRESDLRKPSVTGLEHTNEEKQHKPGPSKPND